MDTNYIVNAAERAAYKNGFYDACLACMKIVMPIPGVHTERPCTDIAEEILTVMLEKFNDE